jgi:hypothetical protein
MDYSAILQLVNMLSSIPPEERQLSFSEVEGCPGKSEIKLTLPTAAVKSLETMARGMNLLPPA